MLPAEAVAVANDDDGPRERDLLDYPHAPPPGPTKNVLADCTHDGSVFWVEQVVWRLCGVRKPIWDGRDVCGEKGGRAAGGCAPFATVSQPNDDFAGISVGFPHVEDLYAFLVVIGLVDAESIDPQEKRANGRVAERRASPDMRQDLV